MTALQRCLEQYATSVTKARVRATLCPMKAYLAAQVDAALARFAIRAIATTVQSAAWARKITSIVDDRDNDLSIERDVAYGTMPEQQLDVVRLRDGGAGQPCLLYLHGGGFQQFSRHTHAFFAVQFARAGYVVFNADYRLSPRHPYPAATDDARTVADLIAAQAEHFGGDPTNLTVAGESAGANLALGLAASGRSMPLAAVVLFSGLLQVSHPSRLWHERPVSRLVRARIASIARDYIGAHARDSPPRQADPWLDPLLWLEQHPERVPSLPPIYASVGTRDPVLSDTLRLKALLAGSSVYHRIDVYGGEPHAFQAMPMRRHARDSWQACLTFLAEARAQAMARERAAAGVLP